MTSNVKLDVDGQCLLCKKVSLPNECVECFVCKTSFHAVCPNTNNEEKLATKTTVANFLLSSTKKNFAFLCDICLTTLERNNAETDTQRINSLENRIGEMSNQLSDIKSLLTKAPTAEPVKEMPVENLQPMKNSIWFNNERLEKVKAPPGPSVLVVGKTNDVQKDIRHIEVVQKVIMDHDVTLQKSYKNKSGELVIVCDSKESRDNLSNIVNSIDDSIPTKSPHGIRPTISIVGLYKEYSKEEISTMLVKQNGFVKKFATNNDIDDHFRVFAVRPTRNNPNIFQAFVSVSAALRDGIKQFGDKITLGLTSCKVYNRFHVKRCNKCQLFGHYAKDCTSLEVYCAKCAGNHETDSCSSNEKKCINCVRSDVESVDHQAFEMKCPAILRQQELLKNIIEKDSLNLVSYTTGHPT